MSHLNCMCYLKTISLQLRLLGKAQYPPILQTFWNADQKAVHQKI